MAEYKFSEVIKNKKRLCESVRCFGCPLSISNNKRNIPCQELLNEYPEEFAEIVMKWAEEHPAITNKQKMFEIITEAFGERIAKEFIKGIQRCSGFSCTTKRCDECDYYEFWENEYEEPKEEK